MVYTPPLLACVSIVCLLPPRTSVLVLQVWHRISLLLFTPHLANKELNFNLAVMSLLVVQTVTRVVSADPSITGPEIAIALSLFTG